MTPPPVAGASHMVESLDVTIDPRNTRGWPHNRRQLDWAMRYIEGETAFDAAINAGYCRSTAKSKSGEFVRRLQPFLLHLQRRKNALVEERFNVNAERVVQGLAAIAFPKVAAYYRLAILKGGIERVVGRAPDELNAQQLAAVKGWTVTEHEGADGRIILDYVYTFTDRVKALLGLAKCLGLFNERIQIELLQAQSADDRVDYTNVPNEVLRSAIERMEQIQAELREGTREDANSDQRRRLSHSRVMSSPA